LSFLTPDQRIDRNSLIRLIRFPTEESVTDYRFERRYDSPLYHAVCWTTGLLATAFFVAIRTSAVFALFGLIFALVTVLLLISIVRGDTSGIEITGHNLTYWVTGISSHRRSINLTDVTRIQYRRFDNDIIFIDLADAEAIRLDDRYFGDICEIVRVLRNHCPEVSTDCLGGPECG
jgi:hypothetical protein